MPWRYSVKMTIIRAGTTVAGLAISDSGVVGSSIEPGDLVGDFVSLSGYDPDRPPAPDRVVDGITFSDGNFVSASSPIYLSITSVNPGTPNLLQILPTTPNVPPTFDFTLNAGDTVIVEARKQALAEAPPFTPGFQDVKLAASLAISGVPVATQGSPTSSADNKAGFTFSFTVQ